LNQGELKSLQDLLLKDKKKTTAKKVRFVFMKSAGHPVVKEVTVSEILLEVIRQTQEDLHG
jgi:3-dehydroquinate synthase